MQFVRSLAEDAPEADRAEFEEMLAEAEKGLTGVREGLQPVIEAGVTEMYMVVSPAPLMRQVPPAVIVPVADDAQRDAVLEFLRQTPMKHEAVEGAVLIGEPAAISVAKATRAEARPDLTEAFAGDHEGRAASAVFAPTPLVSVFGLQALREAAKESPAVPVGLADTLEKLTLARIDVSLPPEPNGVMEMKFADEAAAQQMNTFMEAMRQLGKARASEDLSPEAAESMAAAVAPEQTGASIRVEVTAQELRDTLGKPMLMAIQQAREDTERTTAMSNLRQIGMGIILYSNDFDHTFPDSLDQIVPYLGNDEAKARQIFISPRVDAEVGFAYVRPAEKLNEVKDSSRTILAYERRIEEAEDVVVLFVDGHAETVEAERFRAMAQEQGVELETQDE
jgi:hypothetical protein